jgi:hypothetical protein
MYDLREKRRAKWKERVRRGVIKIKGRREVRGRKKNE